MERPQKSQNKTERKRNKENWKPKFPVDSTMLKTGVYGLAAVAAVGTGAVVAKKVDDLSTRIEQARIEHQNRKLTFDADDYQMTGFNVGSSEEKNLFALYTGHEWILPRTLLISFKENLDRLNEIKASVSSRKQKTGKENQTVASSISLKRDVSSNEYNPDDPKRSTLREILTSMDESVKSVVERIDWDQFADNHYFTETELHTFRQEIAPSVGGSELLSYSMTEIMPSYDGRKNMRMYDFLAQTAGKEFLRLIPSIGDDRAECRGQFQLTGHIESILNHHGLSIDTIRSFEENTDAAAYVSIENLASAYKSMMSLHRFKNNESELGEFFKGSTLTAIMAGYHNRPRGARTILMGWAQLQKPMPLNEYAIALSKDLRSNIEKKRALGISISKEEEMKADDVALVTPYIVKSLANYKAIQETF